VIRRPDKQWDRQQRRTALALFWKQAHIHRYTEGSDLLIPKIKLSYTLRTAPSKSRTLLAQDIHTEKRNKRVSVSRIKDEMKFESGSSTVTDNTYSYTYKISYVQDLKKERERNSMKVKLL
jgi:hypothetical protein